MGLAFIPLNSLVTGQSRNEKKSASDPSSLGVKKKGIPQTKERPEAIADMPQIVLGGKAEQTGCKGEKERSRGNNDLHHLFIGLKVSYFSEGNVKNVFIFLTFLFF